jgi:hypothetical protein
MSYSNDPFWRYELSCNECHKVGLYKDEKCNNCVFCKKENCLRKLTSGDYMISHSAFPNEDLIFTNQRWICENCKIFSHRSAWNQIGKLCKKCKNHMVFKSYDETWKFKNVQ